MSQYIACDDQVGLEKNVLLKELVIDALSLDGLGACSCRQEIFLKLPRDDVSKDAIVRSAKHL